MRCFRVTGHDIGLPKHGVLLQIVEMRFQRSVSALGIAALTAFAGMANADDPYSVSVGSASAKVGEATSISITVTVKGGYKCNDQYPHKIKKLSAGDGAKLHAEKVRGQCSDGSVTFSIPVTPTAQGSHALTGQIRFSICNKSQCLIKTAPLDATVTGT